MAFGTQNEQSTDGGDIVVLFVRLDFVPIEDFVPLVGSNNVFITGVVPDCALAVFVRGPDFALCRTQGLGDSLFHAFLLGHEFGIAAEQNVSAAPGHVGRDGHRRLAACLSHDFCFALVVLGVEHYMLNALFLQQIGEPL